MTMSAAQRGFSIVSAIFLVVVIALIAGFLVSIGSVARTSSTYSVVAMRSHFAAQSGVEWAVHQVLDNPLAPSCFTSPTSFSLPGAGSGAFRVTARCSPQAVTEGTQSYTVFDIDVVAEFGTAGGEDYFRREVAASVSTAN